VCDVLLLHIVVPAKAETQKWLLTDAISPAPACAWTRAAMLTFCRGDRLRRRSPLRGSERRVTHAKRRRGTTLSVPGSRGHDDQADFRRANRIPRSLRQAMNDYVPRRAALLHFSRPVSPISFKSSYDSERHEAQSLP
jgi:hypothetical protein